MSEELYALVGRKQVELEKMSVEYGNLLTVLNKVLSGEFKNNEVTVDMVNKGWAYTPIQSPVDPLGE